MLRELTDQVYSRVAGAPLIPGNAVRLLRDAVQNYPAWLETIASARQTVHFENYILRDDAVGRRFADAFIEAARRGVTVRIIYDWFGTLGRASWRYWESLRAAGVEIRCYNPPRLDQPLGWIARDHRKGLVVDGRVAYVTGLCLGEMWEASPERPGWRDTGVEIRGPGAAEVERAFAETWKELGPPLPEGTIPEDVAPEGAVALRVVATTPGTATLYRLDPLVASLARRTLWLTDAYFAGTSSYVQALRGAAADGVDVRLLVPGAGSDVPVMQTISRAGYRPLLEGGVRVFEWNGPMLHAKTAVADARWARVGSTNLNLASWVGNRELDVFVEDAGFGQEMEDMFRDDLGNATEIVLQRWLRVRPTAPVRHPRGRGPHGSTSRAAAGALRVGNALGSVLAARRLHGPAERWLMAEGGVALAALSLFGFFWPRALAWPIAAISLWLGLALLVRAVRRRDVPPAALAPRASSPAPAAAHSSAGKAS